MKFMLLPLPLPASAGEAHPGHEKPPKCGSTHQATKGAVQFGHQALLIVAVGACAPTIFDMPD
ncbi:hypothetical protein [Mesorhizobium sp. M0047]|uniref:hypothetical protein n=1 Tax=Mesorhizobium sp. M0047 TaxID=2956859 RepID=UPI003335E18D